MHLGFLDVESILILSKEPGLPSSPVHREFRGHKVRDSSAAGRWWRVTAVYSTSGQKLAFLKMNAPVSIRHVFLL